MDKKLVAIVGPTAVGKSALAVKLALKFGGGIVGADSRQVYRHLDVGTAKPTEEMLAQVPHHLLNIIEPDDNFSLAEYQALAYQKIAEIQAQQRLPILAGGSGQYVWAVLEGWQIPKVPPDPAYRTELEVTARCAPDALYKMLLELDPQAAGRIDRRNVRRVIRALEVSRTQEIDHAGSPRRKDPAFEILIIGLTADRAELYRRIDERVERMISNGLVAEVTGLLQKGYSEDLPSLSGIGYRQISRHLRGETSLAEVIRQIKTETHRYARQQYNWFGLQDRRIQWFNIRECPQAPIEEMVARFLEEPKT